MHEISKENQQYTSKETWKSQTKNVNIKDTKIKQLVNQKSFNYCCYNNIFKIKMQRNNVLYIENNYFSCLPCVGDGFLLRGSIAPFGPTSWSLKEVPSTDRYDEARFFTLWLNIWE